MSYGMTKDEFWKSTPRDIAYFLKSVKMREKRKAKELDVLAYSIGNYVCASLSSSVVLVGLADKKAINNIPKYPKLPLSLMKEAEKSKPKISAEEEQRAKNLYTMFNLNMRLFHKKHGG